MPNFQRKLSDAELREVTQRVLRAVRSFGQIEADTLKDDIESLKYDILVQSPLDILDQTLRLLAVSLVFDYEDGRGANFSPGVETVGKQIIAEIRSVRTRLKNTDTDTLKWGRQVCWVLMAYALWHHRNNRLAKMMSALDYAEDLLRTYLVPAGWPFYGTFARLNFYRGLQFRDQGDFEAATTRFQDSFESAQQRRLRMLEERLADPRTKQVEEIFAKCCVARVQAYGFGEIAFLKGDLAGSLTWFRTALSTLEGQGFRRWRLSIESYLQGSTVLISPFTTEGAEKIRQARQRLDQLASDLEKEHKGYSELAYAFSALGALRLEQIRQAAESAGTLSVELPAPIVERVLSLRPSQLHEAEGEDQAVRRHGAVSALISLLCGEVLLRSGRHLECRDEVTWVRRRFDTNGFVQTEADLLDAQLYIAAVEPSRALSFLEHHGHGLLARSNRNQQALWFALAALVAIDVDSGQPLSARLFGERAQSLNSRVRHGFVNYFVQFVLDRVSQQQSGIFAMPYQNVPPIFSLETNEEAAIRNLLRAASAAHPGASNVEDFCELLQRKKSTLYKGKYKRYIDEFLLELRKGRPKKRPHKRKSSS